MQDLKGQIKVLEEKNSGYMDTNMTLEEVCIIAIFNPLICKTPLAFFCRITQDNAIKLYGKG